MNENNFFCCPLCKGQLEKHELEYECKLCNKKFKQTEKYKNFLIEVNYIDKRTSLDYINKLLDEINVKGYYKGVDDVLKETPSLEFELKNTKWSRTVDGSFHGIGKNNFRCLCIGSELGNETEILSNMYSQTFSMDYVSEFLRFQSKRFENLNNIILVMADPIKLPFPDNFFDFIYCKFLFEKIPKLNNRYNCNLELEFLKEIKRVLNPMGVFCIGKTNMNGKKISWRSVSEQNTIHSGQFKASNIEELFNKEKLNYRTYWVLPSLKRPHYSGSLDNSLVSSWFYQNLDVFMKQEALQLKQKIAAFILGKISRKISRKIIKKFFPYQIFCATKGDFSNTVEDFVKIQTGFSNLLLVSRRSKVIIILLDHIGNPTKIVSVKRNNQKFPRCLEDFQRIFPNMHDPEKKIWIEDWLPGRKLDSSKIEEVRLAMKWLTDFQNNSYNKIFSEEEIDEEISEIKNGISSLPIEKLQLFSKWLTQYKKFILINKVPITGVHGDFWIENILFDLKFKKISIIDWELFREKGNSLYDFMLFLYNLMAMTENEPVSSFYNALNERSKNIEIINEVKRIMNKHFKTELDFNLLLKITIIKKLFIPKGRLSTYYIKSKGENTILSDNIYVKMLEILSNT